MVWVQRLSTRCTRLPVGFATELITDGENEALRPCLDQDTQRAGDDQITRPSQLPALMIVEYDEICRYLDSQGKRFAFSSPQLGRPFNEESRRGSRSSENLAADQFFDPGCFMIRFDSDLIQHAGRDEDVRIKLGEKGQTANFGKKK